ncbi:MAG: helix-turn-helix domain-containing protein [Trueperaceae bacterium]
MTKSPSWELLGTLKARLVLAVYAEAATPSEVARKLEMPANTVHYWTRRLLEADLLEQVGQDGRVRTYQARVPADQCEPEACAPFVRNAMQALDKTVMAAAERHDLAPEKHSHKRPAIGIHELRLTPEDVARIVAELSATMPAGEKQAPEGSNAYTVSFIVTPGRVSEFF